MDTLFVINNTYYWRHSSQKIPVFYATHPGTFTPKNASTKRDFTYHAQFCKPPCKINSAPIRWAWSSSPHAAQIGAARCRSPRCSNGRKERCISLFIIYFLPFLPLSLKLTRFEQSEKQSRRACGFWMKWRNVRRSWQRKTARGDDVWWVSNENRCMSFPLYLWATIRKLLSDAVVCVLIMFESCQKWIIPTIVICRVVVSAANNWHTILLTTF